MDLQKRNIVIVGGNFINKGAQSMLFCLVNHCAKKYPNDNIIVLDLFPSLKQDQKEVYRFHILNMHVRTLFRLSFPLLKAVLKKSPKSDSESAILDSIKNARIMYDISGYGASSHNQALVWTLATLLPFRLAATYNVPVQLMPQSLGPFEYSGWKKRIVWPFVKKWMSYPELIFIREPISRKHLTKIKTEKIIDSFDLVLQSDKIDEQRIFKNAPADISVSLPAHAVVVIPNRQLFRLWGEPNTVAFFSKIVATIVEHGQTAVILRHSSDDNTLCNSIYNQTNSSDKIILINEDFYPEQLDTVIEQAEALVSARYHGLVHGLKNRIPVFSIGWAVKYEHLMNEFKLNDFHIGHDDNNPLALIDSKFGRFFEQLPQLKQSIHEKMENIVKQSIYNTYL